MAATNKTPNYNLSQWLPNDILVWDEITADNLKIDTALGNCWNRTNLMMESGIADVRFSNSNFAYNVRRSQYWVVGNRCNVRFEITIGNSKPPTVSDMVLTNLPFPINQTIPSFESMPVFMTNLQDGFYPVQTGGMRYYGAQGFYFVGAKPNDQLARTVASNNVTQNTTFSGVFSYEI